MLEKIITRRAPLAPAGSSTFDPETRSMRAVIAAGAAVQRWDARGEFSEILDPAGMRQPKSGRVQLLNSHRRYDLADVIGSATQIAASGEVIEATLTLSRRADVDPIALDIADGHIDGVSIGYRVLARKEEMDAAGRRRVTATKWELAEVSIVPMPADPKAKIRGETMPPELDNPPANPAPTPAAPVIDTRAAVNGEIRTLARSLGLAQSWIDGQIDANATSDQARAAALNEVMRRSTTGLAPTTQVLADHTDPIAIRSAMGDALAARLSPSRIKIEGRAREFAGYRVLDMVADLANARGDRVNPRDQNALMERAIGAHSTSDFPLLLADAANKALLANYAAAAPTYRSWAARRNFNDFKPHNFLRIGDFPSLKPLNENGEVKYGTLSENREQVIAQEYATGIIVGRRLLINDDLSALADFSSMIAVRTAADENRLVYTLLTGATVLSDGVVLFHASHGNKAGAGTVINVANVGAAVAALRKQKSLDGLPLNLAPRFLVVGPDKELEARQILVAITATKSADANPWSGTMELVVDANIVGNGWYVMAAPEAAPSIVYGYVAGSEGPQITTEIDFDTKAVKVRAGLDFGAGLIDFRGAYFNAGA